MCIFVRTGDVDASSGRSLDTATPSSAALTHDACRSVSTQIAESSKSGTGNWWSYVNMCERGTCVVGVGTRGMRIVDDVSET